MDDVVFQRAAKGDRHSMEAVAGLFYAQVVRLSLALAGRTDSGAGVARFVMKRSMVAMGKWTGVADAQRWYAHHTILTSRRVSGHRQHLGQDTLGGPKPQGKYSAMIKVLRELPVQQREAVILSECESLDLRRVATAMDCSTAAAATHLEAARQTLTLLAGEDYPALIAAMKRTYHTLTPAEELRMPAVKRVVGRHFLPRRIKRWAIFILLLGVAAGGYVAYRRFWPR